MKSYLGGEPHLLSFEQVFFSFFSLYI